MFRFTVLSCLLLMFAVGCASTNQSRPGGREYGATLDETLSGIERVMQNSGLELEEMTRPSEDSHLLVVRQINASARGGGSNATPRLQSLQVTVQRISPSRTSVAVFVPPSSYGASAGTQLRSRFLAALDRQLGN